MASSRPLRTSDLARAVGIHPNTVRRYIDWGLLPPVDRSPSGYRIFTQQHLDCLRLVRLIYAAEYPGPALRSTSNDIIQQAVAGDWPGALGKARAHLAAVGAEIDQANHAAALLEQWARTRTTTPPERPLSIGAVSARLGVSLDVVRNWERNGLLEVPRNPHNQYRLFGQAEIERMQIIRMLSRAGYSHMAILRMFIALDGGQTGDLKAALDTPRPDEDIFTAADHWLSTLHAQSALCQEIIQFIVTVLKRDLEQDLEQGKQTGL